MLSLNTETVLSLSTAHVTKNDIHTMAMIGEDETQQPLPRFINHEYGVLIPLSSDEDSVAVKVKAMRFCGLSVALRYLLRFATQQGYSFIYLDRDASCIESLPEFER
jgi:hypothetical protein